MWYMPTKAKWGHALALYIACVYIVACYVWGRDDVIICEAIEK